MVRRRHKLTAPEWALWAGLVCLAVTLLGSGLWAYRIEKLNRMVVGDLLRIETGCIRFRSHYGEWPNPLKVYYDFHFGIAGNVSNRELFSSLRAVDGPGNVGHTLNPDQQECLWIPTGRPAPFRFEPPGRIR